MTRYLKLFILLAVIPVCLHAKLLPANPSLNASAIIEVYLAGQFEGIILVQGPSAKALPSGKVSYESLEQAVARRSISHSPI